MKFKVFTDQEIFETILLENNKYANWNNILKHHSDVFIDMSQADYDADIALTDDSILFQYLQDSGGKEPIPDEQFFIDFEANNSIVENRPLSAYFLNKTDQEIQSLKECYGLLFQNKNIDDKILSNKYQKNCSRNDIFSDGGLIGWKAMMPTPIFFYNTLIITDPHLFDNDRNVKGVFVNYGVENIISYLDLMLPTKLGIDFHLLIVSSRQKNGFSEARMQGVYDDMNARIKGLRNFNLIIELIITPETIHRRNSFSNYHLVNCDKGFNFFSIDDPSKIHNDNLFKYYDIFEITNPAFGDSHYKEATDEIPKIKKGINTALNTIRAMKKNLEDKKCYGLNPGSKLQNRLINHFP